MAVKDITKRILDDAKKEANQIIKDAQNKASKILAETESAAANINKSLIREAHAALELKESKEVVNARLASRNKILQAKQELIKEVYDQALKSLSGLNHEEYKNLLKSTIKKINGGELIFSKKDQQIAKEIIDSLNGQKEIFSISNETREIDGGFILREGKIETNYSFKTILESHRRDLERQLIEVLFK